MSEIKPLVAIHCLVYNHEPYLRDCFEGFIMQQTNFPFVVIVHDDASTDESAAIIREYEAKYPHFKPIYEKENLYQKGGFGAINEIMNKAIDACGAKYIAMCEGDDYWIDSLKLQKQVDFLETHASYGFIGTKCKILRENRFFSDTSQLPQRNPIDGVILYGDVFYSYAIYGPVARTCSLLYRKSLLDDEFDSNSGDYYMQALLASKSLYASLNSISSVYRVHNKGVSNNYNDKGIISYTQWYILQKKQLKRRFPQVCDFDDDELNDHMEYIKMKIALRQLDYISYSSAKSNIISFPYKDKYIYKIKGCFSFYIFAFFYNFKNKLR